MTDQRHSLWTRTLFTIGIQQMSHRPPLPRRWIAYCVIAYIAPIIALEALPDSLGTVREISWLITLAPAFILSLHFGMLGALAGLLAGTALYVTVQVVLDLNLVPVQQDILLPIYVSYGMLAIAVGWLSQQLHDYYNRLVRTERMAAIGEVAVTLRHELNNALQAITAEAGVLRAGNLPAQDAAGVDTILEMAQRIQVDVQKLATLTDDPGSTEYLDGRRMVDLAAIPEKTA